MMPLHRVNLECEVHFFSFFISSEISSIFCMDVCVFFNGLELDHNLNLLDY